MNATSSRHPIKAELEDVEWVLADLSRAIREVAHYGCVAQWLAHLYDSQEVESSNLSTSTLDTARNTL